MKICMIRREWCIGLTICRCLSMQLKKNPIRIICAEFGLQLILCSRGFQFCTIGLAITDYLTLNLWLECNAHWFYLNTFWAFTFCIRSESSVEFSTLKLNSSLSPSYVEHLAQWIPTSFLSIFDTQTHFNWLPHKNPVDCNWCIYVIVQIGSLSLRVVDRKEIT